MTQPGRDDIARAVERGTVQRISGPAAEGSVILLRPTASGGHTVVERLLRAQFGSDFGPFGALRRRRNELQYPTLPDESTTEVAARDAVQAVTEMIAAAERRLPGLAQY